MPSRVLIVDDEPSILATMAPMLRARGYEVATAMSGKACLNRVEGVRPDIIILDLGLPDMDGLEVCRLVRDGRPTPILVLSARIGVARQSPPTLPHTPRTDTPWKGTARCVRESLYPRGGP